jgi:sirohydrochlorin ferrochelatase
MSDRCKSTLKRGLIIIVHGSRREAANEEFRAIVDLVRKDVGDLYVRVEPAFLDSTSPKLAEAASTLIEAGIVNIDVYPYFLTTGKHADEDIPHLVDVLNAENPGCTLTMLDYLGKCDALVGVLIGHIRAQGGSQ